MDTSLFRIVKLMLKRLLVNQFLRHPEVNLLLDHFEKICGVPKGRMWRRQRKNYSKNWYPNGFRCGEENKKRMWRWQGEFLLTSWLISGLPSYPGGESLRPAEHGGWRNSFRSGDIDMAKILEEQRKVLMPKYLTDVYLGPEYSDKEVEMAIRRAKLSGKAKRVKNIERIAAEAVAKGKIVGWFQGRMEFGPRALGNRSLWPYQQIGILIRL